MSRKTQPSVYELVGLLIKEAARGTALRESGVNCPLPVELPPVGALVVESSTMRRGVPKREGVGWVERIESEDGRPVGALNARVVLRPLALEPRRWRDWFRRRSPLQPWVNASFYVAPLVVTQRSEAP